MAQNVSTAVMEQRVEAHDSLDDFPTPPWATRALLTHVMMAPMVKHLGVRKPLAQMANWTVREPCANRGYMVRPLAEFFGEVVASDIFDYGHGYPVLDYLFPGPMAHAEWTIMNFPFELGGEFIAKSFETPGWIGTAAIVRTAFKESVGRYETLFKDNPPSIVAQFVERVIMTKGIVRDPATKYWDEKSGKMKRPSTATAYCWLVWMKGVPPQPHVWIPQCRKELERPGDYPEPTYEADGPIDISPEGDVSE